MHASTLFDASTTADVILRSSDSVDFFVIKLLLCLVSPKLTDIFSSNHTIISEHGLPIVTVTEDSRTLRCVLLFIYPACVTGCEPSLDIDDLCPVAKAIQKYSMDCIEERIQEGLITSRLLQKHAFRIYALAVHLGWTRIAARAAQNTLETPLSDLPFVDELHMISGADFYQYLSYRFRCKEYENEDERVELAFVSQGPVANEQHSTMAVAGVPAAFRPNAKVDAVLRSSDGIDFYIKKSFLSHLSAVFEELFANSDSGSLNNQRSNSLVFTEEEDSGAMLNIQKSDSPVFTIKVNNGIGEDNDAEENNDATLNNQKGDLPVFTVEEDGVTLSVLLCLLHPYAGEPSISDLKLFPKVWAAAQRYQVTFISQRLEQSFIAFPSFLKEPLRSFAIGVSLGWTKAINACAMETLIKPLSKMEYADEVRMITGADLYRLVEYRFKCANSVGLLLDTMGRSESTEACSCYSCSKYFALVKSMLLDCPRGINMMSWNADSDLVGAARIYLKDGYKIYHLLRKRLILFESIDGIISKVCLFTLSDNASAK